MADIISLADARKRREQTKRKKTIDALIAYSKSLSW